MSATSRNFIDKYDVDNNDDHDGDDGHDDGGGLTRVEGV